MDINDKDARIAATNGHLFRQIRGRWEVRGDLPRRVLDDHLNESAFIALNGAAEATLFPIDGSHSTLTFEYRPPAHLMTLTHESCYRTSIGRAYNQSLDWRSQIFGMICDLGELVREKSYLRDRSKLDSMVALSEFASEAEWSLEDVCALLGIPPFAMDLFLGGSGGYHLPDERWFPLLQAMNDCAVTEGVVQKFNDLRKIYEE